MALGRQIALSLCLLAMGVALLGCGSSDSSREITGEEFLPDDEVAFSDKLDKIQGYVTEGRCETAQSNLDALTGAVQGVPPDTDEGLKTDLLDLLGRLGDQIDSQCVPVDDTTTDTSTDETHTEPTTTEETVTSTSTTTTDTTDPETTDTETTTPPDETSDTPPPPEEPPGHSGPVPGTGGTAPGGKKKDRGGKPPKGQKKQKDHER